MGKAYATASMWVEVKPHTDVTFDGGWVDCEIGFTFEAQHDRGDYYNPPCFEVTDARPFIYVYENGRKQPISVDGFDQLVDNYFVYWYDLEDKSWNCGADALHDYMYEVCLERAEFEYDDGRWDEADRAYDDYRDNWM